MLTAAIASCFHCKSKIVCSSECGNKQRYKQRNQSLGSIETFYKVVESKNLSINQNTNIDYLSSVSITATNYASSNPEIVKIESDNSITAVSSGIAYITITANVGKMIVKVIVK